MKPRSAAAIRQRHGIEALDVRALAFVLDGWLKRVDEKETAK